jgi:hypothetical protein
MVLADYRLFPERTARLRDVEEREKDPLEAFKFRVGRTMAALDCTDSWFGYRCRELLSLWTVRPGSAVARPECDWSSTTRWAS